MILSVKVNALRASIHKFQLNSYFIGTQELSEQHNSNCNLRQVEQVACDSAVKTMLLFEYVGECSACQTVDLTI